MDLEKQDIKNKILHVQHGTDMKYRYAFETKTALKSDFRINCI